jgi:hypothetical protein
MGRNRRDMTCLRPFCFYCEKSFKNEVILHHHQKAKHFSCPKCPKKFSSIDSMIQHAKSQHNENIERVPAANAGRDSVALKIFGMQGVPRMEIENWINRSVNRSWGRIIDHKNKEQRRVLAELAKNNPIEEEQGPAKGPEEKEMEEELEYPLEISLE